MASVRRRSASVVLLAGLLAVFACLGTSLGLALALAPRRLDLVHVAVFDVCQMRAYGWHWQNLQRLPEPLDYDFTKSPESFVLIEVWVHSGPTLSLSRQLPLACW